MIGSIRGTNLRHAAQEEMLDNNNSKEAGVQGGVWVIGMIRAPRPSAQPWSRARYVSSLIEKKGVRVQGGVWVIGMIRGTAAERAGVEQGDQLLAVDGRALDGASPFQAANLLMGAVEEGPAAAPPTAVTVTVRALCLLVLMGAVEEGPAAARPTAVSVTMRSCSACSPSARMLQCRAKITFTCA